MLLLDTEVCGQGATPKTAAVSLYVLIRRAPSVIDGLAAYIRLFRNCFVGGCSLLQAWEKEPEWAPATTHHPHSEVLSSATAEQREKLEAALENKLRAR